MIMDRPEPDRSSCATLLRSRSQSSTVTKITASCALKERVNRVSSRLRKTVSALHGGLAQRAAATGRDGLSVLRTEPGNACERARGLSLTSAGTGDPA